MKSNLVPELAKTVEKKGLTEEIEDEVEGDTEKVEEDSLKEEIDIADEEEKEGKEK